MPGFPHTATRWPADIRCCHCVTRVPPPFKDRLRYLRPAGRSSAVTAAVLLVSLAATSALTSGHDFAGAARPAGVLVAGVLAVRRVPFPVVVLAAAAVTALLRLAGLK